MWLSHVQSGGAHGPAATHTLGSNCCSNKVSPCIISIRDCPVETVLLDLPDTTHALHDWQRYRSEDAGGAGPAVEATMHLDT